MTGPLDRLVLGADGVGNAHDPDRGTRAIHLAQLVRSSLKLDDGVAVTVQQLSCREPGCPPVETVIAVLAAPTRRWHVHYPLTAITDQMMARLLLENPHGDPHGND
ncbi:hypothetical protein OK015_07970 [Mycobacterium sp. Aquia_216]|uniref:hypothetical protein n=1 Tax=Mycobacterium sp. Aquia_216 TaxID=2991729 RepID=UPI00227AF147|nr:hypothetical protein [Mycobacterium sp. Aquia_216]WAJ46393.1 hypothetical protein OK015_07970 [Mycobacterium sp. Aquia_216]